MYKGQHALGNSFLPQCCVVYGGMLQCCVPVTNKFLSKSCREDQKDQHFLTSAGANSAYCMCAMHTRARKQYCTRGMASATPLISRSQGACDNLCEVHAYVQRTGACAMVTVELRWTEERVDNLIVLLGERPCLYSTKLRDYFNRDKKKALDEITAVLGITGKLHFFHTCLLRLLRSMLATMTEDATAACFLLEQYAILPRIRAQLGDV